MKYDLGPTLTDFGTAMKAHSEVWFPEVHRTPEHEVTHIALGLGEEAGEVVGVVKKWDRHGQTVETLPLERLHEELADALVYLSMLGAVTGIDWDVAVEKMVRKCEDRWGETEQTGLYQQLLREAL